MENNMTNLFIVNTVYQLLIAKTIAFENNHDNIILINNTRDSMKRLIFIFPNYLNEFKYIGYFSVLHKEKYMILSRLINLLKNYINYRSLTNTIDFKKVDEIYIGSSINGNDFVNFLNFKLQKKLKKNFNIIEDGMGTYLDSQFRKSSKNSLSKLLMRLIKYKKLDYSKYKYLFTVEKSLSEGFRSKKININNIEKMAVELKDHFPDEIEYIQKQKIIFLGQKISTDKMVLDMLDGLLTNIENYYYRKHPMYTKKEKIDVLPWELLSYYLSEQAILITHSSTASITGNLIYGKKNKILMTINLEEENSYYSYTMKKLNVLMGENILVPKTIEDFKKLLQEEIEKLNI